MEALPQSPILAPKKPWYKKWWVWALAALLLLLFYLSTVFLTQVSQIADAIRTGQIDPATFASQVTRGDFEPSAGQGSVSINVETSDDPFLGPVDAQVVIVEFGDFQCPFCRQAFPTVRELANKYKDTVKFIWRDFPISNIHPDAQLAAEAANCAAEQGSFWAYHDALFINQEDLSRSALINYASQIGLDNASFVSCLSSRKFQTEVLADLQDGLTAGVTGTPTFLSVASA